MLNHSGTVFWLTGLSGSGKTQIGQMLTQALREFHYPTILLDGDHLREVMGDIFTHDSEGRLQASFIYSRLCKMLAEQGMHVVCATISLFREIQEWNRANLSHYLEIFVDVPLDELIKRDPKKIYQNACAGHIKNVVGIDIVPYFPEQPDLIIKNYGDNTVMDAVSVILKKHKEAQWQPLNV
jgi:adenylylsulfate kinase-like enzyme